MTIRLNIGAGRTQIDGFVPIDRKTGGDACTLPYDDGSVEEIRASHVLEHLSFGDALIALKEWLRVLRPGGVLRLAVPDFDRISPALPNWQFFVMGGQRDEDDFHRSVWNIELMMDYFGAAGFYDLHPWEDDGIDCASHPTSLRVKTTKPAEEHIDDVCANTEAVA